MNRKKIMVSITITCLLLSTAPLSIGENKATIGNLSDADNTMPQIPNHDFIVDERETFDEMSEADILKGNSQF